MRLIGPGDADGTADPGARFAAGVAAGLDPQPMAAQADADGTAMTNTSSWWSGLLCEQCGHTFRRGDRVLMVPGRRLPLHFDPALRCAEATAGTQSGDDAADPAPAQFAAGLLAAWPPLHDIPVTRLTARDWQVGRPGRTGRPIVCRYCAHTFRAGEHVVICPCRYSGLADPDREGCGAAVHRDPAAGLPCWENWRPDGSIAVCPVRLNRVEDPGR